MGSPAGPTGPLLSLVNGLQTQAFKIKAMDIGGWAENSLLIRSLMIFSVPSSLPRPKPEGLDEGCWLWADMGRAGIQ